MFESHKAKSLSNCTANEYYEAGRSVYEWWIVVKVNSDAKKYNLGKLSKTIISGKITFVQKKGVFPLYIEVYIKVFLNILKFFGYPNHNYVKCNGVFFKKKITNFYNFGFLENG